jgi:hypothetical protein
VNIVTNITNIVREGARIDTWEGGGDHKTIA